MAKSQKTIVIDHLWDMLAADGGRRVATFDDVATAIKYCNDHCGTKLSPNNPANFMKDLLRGSSASANWPQRLTDMRITGRQAKGSNRILEFIDYEEGQSEPFPCEFEPTGSEEPVILESVSLPLATKSLGRVDESWLVQVAVNLRVLEAHFARSSKLKVMEITHLQVGVKLGKSEIDSLFLAVVEIADRQRINALITCEAKQARDPILADQIVQQVVDAYGSVERLDLGVEMIIPVAIKAVAPKAAIYVVEFQPWSSEEASAEEAGLKSLEVSTTGLYELRPPVPGVGHTPSAAKKAPRKPRI